MELRITDLMDCIQDESVNIVPEGSFSAERIKELTLRKANLKRHFPRRVFVIAAAAALILGLSISAYAADLFGIRALLMPTASDTGESAFSITQPQAVPEKLDSAISEKVEKASAAWQEWIDWRTQYRADRSCLEAPAVFMPPTQPHASFSDTVKNADGSYTVNFYSFDGPENKKLVESRTATAGEYESFERYMSTQDSYGDYDFNYGVSNAEEEAGLEAIAAKYGLRLRGSMSIAYSDEAMTGPGFYSNDELAAKTAQAGCSGNIFYETPAGFDKLYWYDEGTFGVSFFAQLPARGERTLCYCYNSVYLTLSSGNEVVIPESGIAGFTTRSHTAPDGTKVTIISGQENSYIYVYLKNSFFAECIEASNLTNAELDIIADSINYSLIK